MWSQVITSDCTQSASVHLYITKPFSSTSFRSLVRALKSLLWQSIYNPALYIIKPAASDPHLSYCVEPYLPVKSTQQELYASSCLIPVDSQLQRHPDTGLGPMALDQNETMHFLQHSYHPICLPVCPLGELRKESAAYRHIGLLVAWLIHTDRVTWKSVPYYRVSLYWVHTGQSIQGILQFKVKQNQIV